MTSLRHAPIRLAKRALLLTLAAAAFFLGQNTAHASVTSGAKTQSPTPAKPFAGAAYTTTDKRSAAGMTVQSAVEVPSDPVEPRLFQEPGLQATRDYVQEGFADTIDPFGGQLSIQATDLVLRGNGGLDIRIQRSYNMANSKYFGDTSLFEPLGLGWTLHMGRVVQHGTTGSCSDTRPGSSAGNPMLEMPDGARHRFYNAKTLNSTSPSWMTGEHWKAECGPNFTGYIVYSPDGTRYDMTHMVIEGPAVSSMTAFYVDKITDKFGNTITINYLNALSSEIKDITTSDQRRVTFTYYDSGTQMARIKTISANNSGNIWTYNYIRIPGTSDGYFLQSVSRPDGGKWGYEYYPQATSDMDASTFLLKRVALPQSGWGDRFFSSEGYVEYTYKFVAFDPAVSLDLTPAVATKKTFGTGSGTWTFNYRSRLITDQYVYTDVTGPDGNTYTRRNPLTGKVYSGRTSGRAGEPIEDILARRAAGQPHLNAEGFAPPVLDKIATTIGPIRGREQQLIDFYGGAQSVGGTSRNIINGISDYNIFRENYISQSINMFGALPDNSPKRTQF